MNIKSRMGIWMAGLLAGLLLTGTALGQAAEQGGVYVVGDGDVRVKPTQVEIPATIRGEAVLAGETLAKYRPAKKRAIDAIMALKVPGLTVEEKGFSVSHGLNAQQMQQMQWRGFQPQQAAAQSKVVVSEDMRIVLSGIDKMDEKVLMDTLAKVIDGMKDSGLVMTGEQPLNYNNAMQKLPMLIFRLGDANEVVNQAYKEAMEDAQRKAKTLADLGKVKLGGVVSITEDTSVEPGVANRSGNYVRYVYGGAAAGPKGQDSSWFSDVFADISVRARLRVKFAIEGK